MKDKKIIIAIICFCLVAVSVLAILHNQTRAAVPDGCIRIEGQKDVTLKLSDVQTTSKSGRTYNKKGESKKISGEGIDICDLITGYVSSDYEEITVVSDDEYKAVISKAELEIPDNAVLMIENSSARLYVFNDTYSGRNVSNVKRIIVK